MTQTQQGTVPVKLANSEAAESTPVKETKETSTVKTGNLDKRLEKSGRRIAILGVGDGGANVSSLSLLTVGAPSYIYNTSPRGLTSQKHTKAIIIDDTDGSGQDMNYAYQVYDEKGAPAIYDLFNKIKEEIDYVFVVATVGGGTGAGSIVPIVQDLRANFEFIVDEDDNPSPYFQVVAVIMSPSHAEGGKNFFNALKVQKALIEKEIPHFIYDNNHMLKNGIHSDGVIYDKINSEILNVFKLYKGDVFGGANIKSIIDSKDFSNLTRHGLRLTYITSNTQIGPKETLDEYILRAAENTPQPLPRMATCFGLFVKGPKSTIDRLDTSIPMVKAKFGKAVQTYIHIEYGDTFEVGLLTSGSSTDERLVSDLNDLYKDSLTAKKTPVSTEIFGDLDEDPTAMKTSNKSSKKVEGFKRVRD